MVLYCREHREGTGGVPAAAFNNRQLACLRARDGGEHRSLMAGVDGAGEPGGGTSRRSKLEITRLRKCSVDQVVRWHARALDPRPFKYRTCISSNRCNPGVVSRVLACS
jgi:hypothetical protein